MRIQVGSLSEGTHEYRFKTTAADIELGEEFTGDVLVDAVLQKTGRQLALTATITAQGTFTCDRCTASFSLGLRPEYRMFYAADEEDVRDLDPSEVQIINPGLPVIDLTDDVRQTVVLAVPLKLLCRPDCRGLCPGCGTDLNTGACNCPADDADPRWEGLQGFQPEAN